MSTPGVVNLGSLNLDHVYRVPRAVGRGETLSATGYQTHLGGKGLNQSVALARAGAVVAHVGAVGPDGDALVEALRNEGVDTAGVRRTQAPSGHALIQVDDRGDNAIVVFPGANHQTRWEHGLVKEGQWLLTQNETNDVAEALGSAAEHKARVAFNPAPMHPDVKAYPLHRVDLLVVNQTEAEALGDGVKRVHDAGGAVVTTLGADGAVYRADGVEHRVEAERVEAVDTTAAGDTFVGYFLASQLRGLDVPASLRRASRAAAICVTRHGAVPSIPAADEVDRATAPSSRRAR